MQRAASADPLVANSSLDFVPSALFEFAKKPARRTGGRRDALARANAGRRASAAGAGMLPVEVQVAQLVSWATESLSNLDVEADNPRRPPDAVLPSRNQRRMDLYHRSIDELQRLVANYSPAVGEAFSDFWAGYRAAATKHHAEQYVDELSKCARQPTAAGQLLAADAASSPVLPSFPLCRVVGRASDEQLNATNTAKALAAQLSDSTVDRNRAEQQIQQLIREVDCAMKARDEAAAERDAAVFGRAALEAHIGCGEAAREKLQDDFDALMQDNNDLKRKQARLKGEISQLQKFETMAGQLDNITNEKAALMEKVAELETKVEAARNNNENLKAEMEIAAAQHRQELEDLANASTPMVSNLDGSRKLVNRAFLKTAIPAEGDGTQPGQQAKDSGLDQALDDFWGVSDLAITAADIEKGLENVDEDVLLLESLPLMQLGEVQAGSNPSAVLPSAGGARASSRQSGTSSRQQRTAEKSKGSSVKVQRQLFRVQGELKRIMAEKAQQTVNLNQERKRRKDAQSSVSELQETVVGLKRSLDSAKAEMEAMATQHSEQIAEMESAHIQLIETNISKMRDLQERIEVERKAIKQLERAKARAEDKLKAGVLNAKSEERNDLDSTPTSWRADWRQILSRESDSERALEPMPTSSLLRISATVLAEWLSMGRKDSIGSNYSGGDVGLGAGVVWRPQLPELVYDFFLAKHGGWNIAAAERDLANFAVGLRMSFTKSERLRTWAVLAGILDRRDVASGLNASDAHNAAEFYLGAVICVQQLFSADKAGEFFLQQHVNPMNPCYIPTGIAERAVRELFSRMPRADDARVSARVEAALSDMQDCLDGPFAPTVDADRFLAQLLYSRQKMVEEGKVALERRLNEQFSGDALDEGFPSGKVYEIYRVAALETVQHDSIVLRPITDRMAAVLFAEAIRRWKKLRKSRRAGQLTSDVQLLSKAISTAMATAGVLSPASITP